VKTKRAFIKLNGEIGEKEAPAIEYVDRNYGEKVQQREKEITRLISGNHEKDRLDIST
jgi:hypothetical protein